MIETLNNGIGHTSYGHEVEYDEDKAFKDALEVIADSSTRYR